MSGFALDFDLTTPASTLRTLMESTHRYQETQDNMALELATQTLSPHFLANSKPEDIEELTLALAGRLKELAPKGDGSDSPSAQHTNWVDMENKLLAALSKSNRVQIPGTFVELIQWQDGEDAGLYFFTTRTLNMLKTELQLKEAQTPFHAEIQANRFLDIFDRSWLDRSDLFGLRNSQWLKLVALIVLGFVVGLAAKLVVAFCIRWVAPFLPLAGGIEKDKRFSSRVLSPVRWLINLFIWSFGLPAIGLPEALTTTILGAVKLAIIVVLVWLADILADQLGKRVEKFIRRPDTPVDSNLAPIVQKTLRISIFVLTVMIGLQNLGIQVASILAGLGLGGLALALAAQDTASNFFGSLMIYTDQPFKVGDFVRTKDGDEGIVEEIGLRSTRIRTFFDSQVNVPNSAMANMPIDNMGRRRVRRVNTQLGIAYDTPPAVIESFCEGIKKIFQSFPEIKQDIFHVGLWGFGSSSLDILINFFIVTESYDEEVYQRQRVFLQIIKLAKELNVEFAFPTTTLHVASTPEHPDSKVYPDIDTLKATSSRFSTLHEDHLFTPRHLDKASNPAATS